MQGSTLKRGRLLRHARLGHANVRNNSSYAFSHLHALSIYPLNAIYTFIPKNACSTMRFSIALANGFVRDIGDINWIHHNNATFVATKREIATADYTFVILRCPYRRVASCFLDKFVRGKGQPDGTRIGSLPQSFHDFLTMIRSQERHAMNQHWRNQSDFLHYETYDDVFSLEAFPHAIDTLRDRGLAIYDTRATLRHDLAGFLQVEENCTHLTVNDLRQMMRQGRAPSYSSMFGEAERRLVRQTYADDIKLYSAHFGTANLLFPSGEAG